MNFPLLYHKHYSHHLEDLPFWLDLAERQGGRILELGCGTGRVLLPLVKAGHKIFGLDRDLAMLSLLRYLLAGESSPDVLQNVPIFQADIRTFHLDTCFNLILLPCNTWSTLDPTGRQAALEKIHLHLCKGGIFAASLPNPVLLREVPSRTEAEIEECFEHPLSGNPVQVSSSWVRQKDRFKVTWYYDHLMPDGGVERLILESAQDLCCTDTYLQELNSAGLQLSDVWGDFNRRAYTSNSPHLILAAKKI